MKRNVLLQKRSSYKKSILIFLLTICALYTAFAQNKQITGKVTTSDDGGALPGVTVKVKGTSQGVTTDINGSYKISAPANATLVFSFIGFTTQEIVVGDNSVINAKLTPDINTLAEVAVVSVGYGTQKRTDLTGSISSVSAATLESMPVTSTDQALQGRAAGVQVTSNDGSPGGNVTVLIRGTGSLATNGNAPLYVVDGYPLDAGGINNINPDDIASIDVLKDASSTAIYGIRAANGVVIITTKRGKKNGTQVTANAYDQFQSKPKELSVLNANQFATLANQQSAIPGNDFTTFSGWSNPASLHNIDWQNAVYGNGETQNYDVAIRGGSDKIQVAASLAYYNQNGIVLDSYFHRATVNTSVDAEPAKWLKTATNVKYTYQQGNNPFGTGSLIQLAQLPPTLDGGNKLTNQVKDAQGNYGFFNPIYTDVLSYGNPVYAIETNQNQPSNNFLLANASLEVTLLPGLKIKTNGGVNAAFSSDIYDQPTDTRENDQYGSSAKVNYGYYSQTTSQTIDWLLENTLSYDKTFGKHTINFVGGFSGQKTIWDGMEGSGIPPTNTVIHDLSQVTTLELQANNPPGSNTGNGQNIVTLASEFARLSYNYDEKYFITGTVRRDGSSKFDTQNQYGTFPSGAVSWRAKQESFLKNVTWLSNLKLRASYGETGNQSPIVPFQYEALFVGNRPASFNPGGIGTSDDNLGYPFNKVYQNGFAAEQPANPGLKWETDTQADGGIDMAFLNGDLTVTADYYDRKSKNFLLTLEVPAQTGYQYETENVGSMDNKGLELMIDYQHRVNQDLRFGATLTFSTLSNKLTSITSGTNEISNFGGLTLNGPQWTTFSETFIGQPVGEFYGYKVQGIIQSQAQINALNAQAQAKGYAYYYSSATGPGDFYFADVHHLGAVVAGSAQDETSLGSPIPKFYGGINLTATYKAWDVIAYFYGVYGNKILNYEQNSLESFQNQGFVGIQNIGEQYYQNAWTPQNHSNTYPAINANDNTILNNVPSSAWIQNGSFLKLKNFTVGYTLPKELLAKIGVTKVRFYVSSQNLFTITGYKGLDPEVGSQGGNATQNGVDNGIYPSSRFFTAGINATF
jgi:TonB-linked SusC/RagA family outer membrane protein